MLFCRVEKVNINALFFVVIHIYFFFLCVYFFVSICISSVLASGPSAL